MAKIQITFPDGTINEYDSGITGLEIAKSIGERLARDALAVKVNDRLQGLNDPIEEDATVKIITFKDDEGVDIFRHSSAHILAAAVKRLYPNTKFGVGPAVEEGFYYDMDIKLTQEDIPKIEAEMKKIVSEKAEFKQTFYPKDKALKKFAKDELKSELIEEKADEKVSIYKVADFEDFCRGPHVPNTGYIKAFKITKLAGAYWKGDKDNVMLTRVYGISFPDKKQLTEYLHLIEEAEKRDHRKLGKDMELFSVHEEGPGFVFFHDKGAFIYNTLLDFMRAEMRKRDYQEVRTPIILNKSLWLRSGHWDHYKENMYFTKVEEGDFAVKPMNCPANILVFKTKMHSYRDLPLRSGEFGLVHRHELSGVLSGLFRVRAFTQDDAHHYCTEDQLESEILHLIEFTDYIYKTFGFDYHVELSTKPEKAMGSDEMWDKATAALQKALEKTGKKYKINPGDGAFYGPKIDFHIKDAIGRTWQCGTIQCDFSMPEKFDVTYEGKDGKKHRPAMLHRTIYGSLERFIGILIEHYAGKFPMWLSPVQIRILTIADRFDKYAKEIKQELEDHGLRVELDLRSESIPKKVRDFQLSKTNYALVVGEKEQKDGTVTVRTRENKVEGAVKLMQFAKRCMKEVADRA